MTVQGVNSSGQNATGKPVELGGVDSTGKVRPLKVGSDGTLQTAGSSAGLTDTQLRAAAVPVSGTVTATGPVTDAQLRAVPVPISGTTTVTQATGTNMHVVVDAAPATAVTGTFFQATQPVSIAAAVAVNGSAAVGAANSEQCATSNAGGTTIAVPAGTRTFELQNLGPNPVSCTLDGQAPVAGSLGHRIAGLTSGVDKLADAWSVDILAAVTTLKCIAATQAQSTGACLQFTVVK